MTESKEERERREAQERHERSHYPRETQNYHGRGRWDNGYSPSGGSYDSNGYRKGDFDGN